MQVVGIPGSIDNNIEGTISLGFQSAVALADQSIESLKATSAAMGTVIFCGGHGRRIRCIFALACCLSARARGCWSMNVQPKCLYR